MKTMVQHLWPGLGAAGAALTTELCEMAAIVFLITLTRGRGTGKNAAPRARTKREH